jgi:aspartyl aminopeptidase
VKLNRARKKLKKNGFEQKKQVPSATSSIRGQEVWVDKEDTGTLISFFIQGDEVDGAFKVHGRESDQPQLDYWASTFTRNLTQAIRFSRC